MPDQYEQAAQLEVDEHARRPKAAVLDAIAAGPDPWAHPGTPPTHAELREEAYAANPTAFLRDCENELVRLAADVLCLRARLYGVKVHTVMPELRRRVQRTVSYWCTGSYVGDAILWEDYRGDVRAEVVDGTMPAIREALRVWCELLTVSILAGGVVRTEEVR